jgi:UDP:flavonoid glycosyltransferase YjiC (YdhE family)
VIRADAAIPTTSRSVPAVQQPQVGYRGVELVLCQPTLTSVPASFDAAAGSTPANAGSEPPVWRYRSARQATGPVLPGQRGDPDCPLVYVPFGSVVGRQGWFDGLFPAMLKALSPLPVRVLMTTELVSTRPAGHLCRRTLGSRPWWPQEAAMREASVIIGTAGSAPPRSPLPPVCPRS